MARLPRGKYNGCFKFACIPPSRIVSRQQISRKSCDSRHVSAVRSCSARPTESSRRGCKVLMTRANRLSSGSGMKRDARVPTHRGIGGRGSNNEPPHNFFVDSLVHRNRIFETRNGSTTNVPSCRSMCNIRIISASSIFIAICVRK